MVLDPFAVHERCVPLTTMGHDADQRVALTLQTRAQGAQAHYLSDRAWVAGALPLPGAGAHRRPQLRRPSAQASELATPGRALQSSGLLLYQPQLGEQRGGFVVIWRAHRSQ